MNRLVHLATCLALAAACTKKDKSPQDGRRDDDARARPAAAVVDPSLIVEKDGPLPPHPGEAGRATLEGIDSDADGVRDDVQIWIAQAAPESKRTRTALRQVAMFVQSYLAQSGDAAKARSAIQDAAKGQLCLSSLLPLEQAIQLRQALKAEMLDTRERTLAELDANHAFSGQAIRLPARAQWSEQCRFDASAMEN